MSGGNNNSQKSPFGVLLTVKELAGMLKVPVSWIYERTQTSHPDRIPHIKLGKYLRFELRAIEEYFKVRSVPEDPDINEDAEEETVNCNLTE